MADLACADETVRAGDAGQGFAVVASGVKKLASQTAQATEDISQQVKDIQQAVERTASALQNVHASVGSINEADSNLRAVLEEQTAELDEIALRAYLNAQGVADEDVAEFYTPFNHKNWEEVVTWIRRFGASGDAAIVTTVRGDANNYFYSELGRQGITAASLPAMTLSIGEAGPEMAGHLAAWSYLHEIDSPENKTFVSAWRRFCNAPNVVTDDPMEATWIGFNLWKEAVSLEGSVDVSDVRRALGGLRLKAPSGFEVVMDLSNHHLHKPAVIGRITADARIVPIWISQGLIAPEPWSPWLERYDSEPRTAPRSARELALAS